MADSRGLLTNLPVPVSSFIGRETELAEVRALVGGSRLVTLTGTGGAGKTRLQQQHEVSGERRKVRPQDFMRTLKVFLNRTAERHPHSLRVSGLRYLPAMRSLRPRTFAGTNDADWGVGFAAA
jgi:hypothetical protein